MEGGRSITKHIFNIMINAMKKKKGVAGVGAAMRTQDSILKEVRSNGGF